MANWPQARFCQSCKVNRHEVLVSHEEDSSCKDIRRLSDRGGIPGISTDSNKVVVDILVIDYSHEAVERHPSTIVIRYSDCVRH